MGKIQGDTGRANIKSLVKIREKENMEKIRLVSLPGKKTSTVLYLINI